MKNALALLGSFHLVVTKAGEGDMIEAQVDEVRAVTGQEVGTAAADAGYAFAKIYGGVVCR